MFKDRNFSGHVLRSIRATLSSQLELLQHAAPTDMSDLDVIEPEDPRHVWLGVEFELERCLRDLEEFLAILANARKTHDPSGFLDDF